MSTFSCATCCFVFIAGQGQQDFYPNDYPYPDPASFNNFSQFNEEPFQLMSVVLERQVSGFGFRIIGGREEGSQATIGGIVAGGAADLDGRLMVSIICTMIMHQRNSKKYTYM